MVRFLGERLGTAFPHLFWPWVRRSHAYLWPMTKKGHQKFCAGKNHFFPKKGRSEILAREVGGKPKARSPPMPSPEIIPTLSLANDHC